MSETYVHEPYARLLAVDAGEIVQPHPGGGWPEFTMTLRFYVTSDDPEVVADVQRRVFERWTRNDDPDGAVERVKAAEVNERDPGK